MHLIVLNLYLCSLFLQQYNINTYEKTLQAFFKKLFNNLNKNNLIYIYSQVLPGFFSILC